MMQQDSSENPNSGDDDGGRGNTGEIKPPTRGESKEAATGEDKREEEEDTAE